MLVWMSAIRNAGAHRRCQYIGAPDLGELAIPMANDVHQILNGAKPVDIPFYRPSKFQLIINMKAVRAIELSLPQSLVAGADE
jgi:putative ABC transport system substrate-binding protein